MSTATILIGLAAQAFFSARTLIQWILSERARRVLSPSVYWIFSLAGAYLLCIYGWLRADFSIVFGQFITYYIYMWNLRIKGVMRRLPTALRCVLVLTPLVALAMIAGRATEFVRDFFCSDVPLWLIVFGTAGQVIFTLRFVFQYVYSHSRGESLLPSGFWIISLIGSAIIVSYGAMRHDPILILGQSVGLVVYTRNLFIRRKEKRAL